MLVKKSTEELTKMYAKIGVDYSKLTEAGETAFVITTFAHCPEFIEKEDELYNVTPVIYAPRKESAYEDEEYNLRKESEKEEYLKLCENAIERYKILQHLLKKHIDEIKTQGYPSTSVYYPELEEFEKEQH